MSDPSVECGCGFSATGPDQDKLLDLLQAHVCPSEAREAAPKPWHESVFSFDTLMIVIVIMTGLAVILHPDLWR